MRKNIFFKQKKDMFLFFEINPHLMMILSKALIFLQKRLGEDFTLYVTQTIADPIPNVSVSTTHKEGRAVDIGVLHIPRETIDSLCYHFNYKYGPSYGTSQTGENPVVCVYEPEAELGPHLHFQIRRNL